MNDPTHGLTLLNTLQWLPLAPDWLGIKLQLLRRLSEHLTAADASSLLFCSVSPSVTSTACPSPAKTLSLNSGLCSCCAFCSLHLTDASVSTLSLAPPSPPSGWAKWTSSVPLHCPLQICHLPHGGPISSLRQCELGLLGLCCQFRAGTVLLSE